MDYIQTTAFFVLFSKQCNEEHMLPICIGMCVAHVISPCEAMFMLFSELFLLFAGSASLSRCIVLASLEVVHRYNARSEGFA